MMQSARWSLVVAGAALVAGSIQGCSKKPEPQVPPPPAASATAPAPAAAPAPAHAAPASPTETGVRIDDAILKACGIAAPKAYFPFDSANLQASATEPLEAVAKCFASGPLKGRTLKLVGHADPRGESEYNFTLGHARADAVGSFLLSKGLDKEHLSTTSRGSLDATGADEAGWALDRRVDLMLGQ